jgi:hypothetical protein
MRFAMPAGVLLHGRRLLLMARSIALAKGPESQRGFLRQSSRRKAGPTEGPALKFSSQPVLETEMCATRERKRRKRASRHRDPLDELHGTPLPVSGESSPGPNGLVLPSLTDPLLGDIGPYYRGSP